MGTNLPEDCGFGEWSDRQFTFSDTDLVLGPFILDPVYYQNLTLH